MHTPLTTYRLQFHRGFPFRAARGLLAYLHELGVTDLYASPLTTARAGSGHGYDVIDPERLNPELGTGQSFRTLTGALRRRRMGLLLDIVPNHMAAGPENRWWRDVLASGRRSRYADFFDIDWEQSPPASRNKVVLPVLGRSCTDCLRAGDLRIQHEEGDLRLVYGALHLPLDIETWGGIIRPALESTSHRLGRRPAALRRLGKALDTVERGGAAPRRSRNATAEWWTVREKEMRAALASASRSQREFRRALNAEIDGVNGAGGDRPDREALERILFRQNYRLIHWRDAGNVINYRRFFNISELVCLRMEDRRVFDAWHVLVRRLVRTDRLQGLRIDHVAGLWDPGLDLRRMRAACGRPLYTVVEKILVGTERLPPRWPVAGTTGYDFLNVLNRLFIEPHGGLALRRIYRRFTGDRRHFEDLVYRAKRCLLAADFKGQMRVLGDLFLEGAGPSRGRQGPSERQLRQALEVTTACVPVYRTYVDGDRTARSDAEIVLAALREARRRAPRLPAAAFAAVERALLPRRGRARSCRLTGGRRKFIMRWQQLTGPLMAKGHEDTALYIDHHLTSLNEVGGSPDLPGLTITAFHRHMLERLRHNPLTMNATATHDTKRGEDVRARINVLTEIPEQWSACLADWHRWNRKARTRVRGREVPTPAEEALVYQTLLGAWPADHRGLHDFGARVQDYLIKSAREAKEHTSWNQPDIRHEAALRRFVEVILDRATSGQFLASFHDLRRTVARAGAMNSLAQVVIKATAPGVPDFYQGSELSDLNLVDPDNRRPVDFTLRRSLLAGLRRAAARDRAAMLRDIVADPTDGRIKLYTTWRSLRHRRREADLFRRGRYQALEATGHGRERICVFARRLRTTWTITVAPRFCASRIVRGEPLLGQAAWGTGAIRVPARSPRNWRNVLTGETVRAVVEGRAGVLTLAEVLNSFPVALLAGSA